MVLVGLFLATRCCTFFHFNSRGIRVLVVLTEAPVWFGVLLLIICLKADMQFRDIDHGWTRGRRRRIEQNSEHHFARS